MGNVNVKEVKNVERIRIREFTGVEPLRIREFSNVEPLRIGQIAPAAVHIKELNHIDPISVDSLSIDQIRNLDPVRVERFDVTSLPTVNVSLSRFPAMDVNLRRMPPIAVGLHQDFQLPSQYTVHARLLGFEVMRFHIHGTTGLSPRDRARREQVRTHERSHPDVAAVGNPAIPVSREERSVTVRVPIHCPTRGASPRPRRRSPPRTASGISPGAPHHSFSLDRAETTIGSVGSGGGR